MSANVCQCQTKASNSAKMARSRRIATVAGYLLPSALLVFMPKCPLCFAAYFALATGLGISATAAGYLRMATICLCVVFLVLTVADRILKLPRRLTVLRFLAER